MEYPLNHFRLIRQQADGYFIILGTTHVKKLEYDLSFFRNKIPGKKYKWIK